MGGLGCVCVCVCVSYAERADLLPYILERDRPDTTPRGHGPGRGVNYFFTRC